MYILASCKHEKEICQLLIKKRVGMFYDPHSKLKDILNREVYGRVVIQPFNYTVPPLSCKPLREFVVLLEKQVPVKQLQAF